jgi:hypothetical protein
MLPSDKKMLQLLARQTGAKPIHIFLANRDILCKQDVAHTQKEEVVKTTKGWLVKPDFQWQRPASRRKCYMWQAPGLQLVPGGTPVAYKPDPVLYLEFARLQPTKEAILKFANRHGTLSRRPDHEDLGVWRQAIHEMRTAVALKDALVFGHWDKLRNELGSSQAVPLDDVVGEAGLRLWRMAQAARADLVVELKLIDGRAKIELQHQDLRAFMRFMFVRDLIGVRRFEICRTCHTFFTLEKGQHSNQTTCSNACRYSYYRQRQRRARELARQGKTVQAIAKKLKAEFPLLRATLAQIKVWLKQRKR